MFSNLRISMIFAQKLSTTNLICSVICVYQWNRQYYWTGQTPQFTIIMEDKDQTSYPHSLASVASRCHNGKTCLSLSLSLSLCLALVDTHASALNTTFYRLFKWQLEFNKGRLHYFFMKHRIRSEHQLTLQLLVAIIVATFLPISFIKVR
jgi:hypothetical protein